MIENAEEVHGLMDMDWGEICTEWYDDPSQNDFFYDDDVETLIIIEDDEVSALVQTVDMDGYVSVECLVAQPGNGYGTQLMEHICALYGEQPMTLSVVWEHDRLIEYYERFGFTTKSRVRTGVIILNRPADMVE